MFSTPEDDGTPTLTRKKTGYIWQPINFDINTDKSVGQKGDSLNLSLFFFDLFLLREFSLFVYW